MSIERKDLFYQRKALSNFKPPSLWAQCVSPTMAVSEGHSFGVCVCGRSLEIRRKSQKPAVCGESELPFVDSVLNECQMRGEDLNR